MLPDTQAAGNGTTWTVLALLVLVLEEKQLVAAGKGYEASVDLGQGLPQDGDCLATGLSRASRGQSPQERLSVRERGVSLRIWSCVLLLIRGGKGGGKKGLPNVPLP